MANKFDFLEDVEYELYGISSTLEQYRLSWEINKMMDWKLQWEEDVEMLTKAGTQIYLRHCYRWQDEPCNMHLLRNKDAGKPFLPEYPHLDYLLKVEDELAREWNHLKKQLRQIEGVQAVFLLDKTKIKAVDNLIFD